MKMTMKILGLTLGAVLLVAGLAAAQEEEACAPPATAAAAQEEDMSFTVETVSGEVTGISSRYISILYDRDYDAGIEYEALIPLDEKSQIKHKRYISEIKVGDLVSVEYEKPTEHSKMKAKALSVNFIQSGVANLVTEQLSSEPEADTP